MPIDVNNDADERVLFWNRVYRTALITLVLFIAIIAAVGVSKVFTISNQLDIRTKAIQGQMQCIATFFTQNSRQ